jgi:hypothetical protein
MIRYPQLHPHGTAWHQIGHLFRLNRDRGRRFVQASDFSLMGLQRDRDRIRDIGDRVANDRYRECGGQHHCCHHPVSARDQIVTIS